MARMVESNSVFVDIVTIETLLDKGTYEAKSEALELLYGLRDHSVGKDMKILDLSIDELITALEEEL